MMRATRCSSKIPSLRYKIGTDTKGLKRNEDGSFVVAIQTDRLLTDPTGCPHQRTISTSFSEFINRARPF